jgi:UDP-glucose 4-epimerase
MARMFAGRRTNVLILDSLEFGHREAIPGMKLTVANVGDRKSLDRIFSKNRIDAVMHFAGYISVEESVRKPRRYFENNVVSPHELLEAMEDHGVNKLIFSSSAAVYGTPHTVPIPEDHPTQPTSPYGLTKLCFEELLAFYDRKGTIRSMSLRYFNAAGASLDGAFGEAHEPETHIIPRAIHTVLSRESTFSLFGTKYKTRDGTCERDYIHVDDLCGAHIVALEALLNGHATDRLNIGTGIGVTNAEVIEYVRLATGSDFPVIRTAPRPGDVGVLVADPTKMKKQFGWAPKHSDIETIIKTAWKWHKNHPDGYKT